MGTDISFSRNMNRTHGVYILALICLAFNTFGQTNNSGWTVEAAGKKAMTVIEAKVFMKRLASFVVDNHLKTDPVSPQKGMIYEYFWVRKKGTVQQWIQGEGLDTMHDGSWFAVAMINASRSTGDPFYRDILLKWQLPFYLKILNHADELFTSERNDGRPGDDRGWRVSKEWLLQGREKGFVPYWWDDGASVSLEMLNRKDKDEHVNFAGRNEWGNRPNPEKRLSGYSHGSSSHMAQDLAAMLEQAWLLVRESDAKLTSEITEATANLQESRTRHGAPAIPMVKAAHAIARSDSSMLTALPAISWNTVAAGRSDYRRALFAYKPGEKINIPGFADDQQYRYYVSVAREGTLTEPAAFWLVYDAFTLPMLYRMYCDDDPAPPGINVFDLHPYSFINGKPVDYRSQRKGPNGKPRPIGSRFGPQNMVVCGWGLQALKMYPDLWIKAQQQITANNFFPTISGAEVKAALEKELGQGLLTWEAIFNQYGYIPTGIGAGSVLPGVNWDEFSDTGGYAHLISACAQWILYLEDKRDWELHRIASATK